MTHGQEGACVISRVRCRMASEIVSDLSWYQKLSAVRSKLFSHEYENNTHEPLLSTSDGARNCRMALRCLLLYC